MTYDATETSAALGRPVEIYTWNRSTLVWRETSADRDVPVAGNTYTAIAISRSGIEQGAEMSRSALKVTVPRDHDIAELYRVAPPSDVVTLTVQQYHEGDGQLQVIWSGRIVAVSFSATTAEITLEPVYTAVRRTGLRRVYQRQCPHVLFGAKCGVVAADFREDFTVSAVSGLTITATGLNGHPDGWWEGGYVKWEISTGIFEHRFIEGHTGNSVTVDRPLLGLAVSAVAQFFPGCDHSIATCQSKYANQLNYGGMPYSPQKNPFGSDPLF